MAGGQRGDDAWLTKCMRRRSLEEERRSSEALVKRGSMDRCPDSPPSFLRRRDEEKVQDSEKDGEEKNKKNEPEVGMKEA